MKYALLLALVSVQVFSANSRYSKDYNDGDKEMWDALNYVNEAMKGRNRGNENWQYDPRASWMQKTDQSQWGPIVYGGQIGKPQLSDLYYKGENLEPKNNIQDYFEYNLPDSDLNKESVSNRFLEKLLSKFWQEQMSEKNGNYNPSSTRLKYPTDNDYNSDENYYYNDNLDDYYYKKIKELKYPDYRGKYQQNNAVWMPKSQSDIKEMERMPSEEEINILRAVLEESVDKLISTAAETIAEDIIMGILESGPDNIDELTRMNDNEEESENSNQSDKYYDNDDVSNEEENTGTEAGKGEEMIGYDEANSEERSATAQFLPNESDEQSVEILEEDQISDIVNEISPDSDILNEEDLELIDLLVKEWESEKEEKSREDKNAESNDSTDEILSSDEIDISTKEIVKSLFDDFQPEPTSASNCPAVQYMSDGCAAVDSFPGLGDNGYKTAFLEPCNRHQICYICGQTYKISQEICNEAFYTALQDECEENETCLLHSDYFYVAVIESRRSEIEQSEFSPIQNLVCQRSCVLDYLKENNN